MTRLEKLCATLLPNECAIISSDINRRYFTGMKSSAGTVLCFQDKAYLLIDFRYIEKAKKSVVDCQVILEKKLYEQINLLIADNHADTMYVEAEAVSVAGFSRIKEKLSVNVSDSNKLSAQISKMRIVKSQQEIDKMISAQRIAEKAFSTLLDELHEGMTEKEMALRLDFLMLSGGAEALSFDTIALSGKNTSLPHGVPSDKKIEKGEFLLFDFGAVVDGYHSDMTLTVCLGEPDDEMTRVYNTVLEAQKIGIENVRAGVDCKALHNMVADLINKAGYEGCFGHGLGHGVGLEIHENPIANSRTNDVLEENMIVTVEPGIYIENKFGVRIEDFVVVTKNGCFNMTNMPKELVSVKKS